MYPFSLFFSLFQVGTAFFLFPGVGSVSVSPNPLFQATGNQITNIQWLKSKVKPRQSPIGVKSGDDKLHVTLSTVCVCGVVVVVVVATQGQGPSGWCPSQVVVDPPTLLGPGDPPLIRVHVIFKHCLQDGGACLEVLGAQATGVLGERKD